MIFFERLADPLLQYINKRPNLKKIVANTGWLTFEQLFRLSVGMLVSIVVARYLGPVRFGVLGYASSLIAFLGTFVYLGLSGLVIRDLIRYPKDKDVILGTTFVLKLAGGFLGYCILAAVILFGHANFIEKEIILIIGLTLFFRPFDVIDFWFHAQIKAKFTVLTKGAAFIVASLGKLLLVFSCASLVSFALIISLEAALSAFLLLFCYELKGQSFFQWKTSFSRARGLLSQSWLLILSGILATVYLKIDQVMLRWMIGPGEVGVYTVAVSFSEVWYFIPSAIAMSIYPTLISQKEKDEIQYQQSIQKTMDILFSIAFIVALIFTLIGPKLILFLYGEPYQKAGYILMIHIWAGTFIFMRSLFSKWIFIENMLIFSLFTQGLGALANVGLNLVLIKPLAGYGAAFATLISYATASYFCLFFDKKTRNIAIIMSRSIIFPFKFLYEKSYSYIS
jgi:O-antigen/teichoic acid export membrane protein